MDEYEKMHTCKYHEEGYLEDKCLYEDEVYNFDDPDNAYYLWITCKDCKNYKPKETKRN